MPIERLHNLIGKALHFRTFTFSMEVNPAIRKVLNISRDIKSAG